MPTWTNRCQPTIDEAAALLPDDARSIRGKVRGQTSPAQIHPLTTYAETDGAIYETRTTCYAATTMIQLILTGVPEWLEGGEL